MIKRKEDFFLLPGRAQTILNFSLRRLQLTLKVLWVFNFSFLTSFSHKAKACAFSLTLSRSLAGEGKNRAWEKKEIVQRTTHHLVMQFREIKKGKAAASQFR